MVAAIPFDLLIFRSEDEALRGSGEGEVRWRERVDGEKKGLHIKFWALEEKILFVMEYKLLK